MDAITLYRRLLLHAAKWWAASTAFVCMIIATCILSDWIGRIGWGDYPWYSLPAVLAFTALAVVIRRAAVKALANG